MGEGLNHIQGKEFDEPLIISGKIEAEPERYVAEKPYDLTRYEYSIVKKKYQADFWLNIISGGTAGLFISVAGKIITALLDKQKPILEVWEIIAVIIGIVLAFVIKIFLKSDDDKEKDKLIGIIDDHFSKNKPRRLHLTNGEEK
ncbi:hypothetical protein ABE212_07885 [Psychrobacter pacificensis]|uniref:hypothetical protein n=1 Tax=Psychrobacter pacificensis TaxID=112002 RepID=UPI003D278A28